MCTQIKTTKKPFRHAIIITCMDQIRFSLRLTIQLELEFRNVRWVRKWKTFCLSLLWTKVSRQYCRHVAQIHFLRGESTCQCFTNIGKTCVCGLLSLIYKLLVIVARSYTTLNFRYSITYETLKVITIEREKS